MPWLLRLWRKADGEAGRGDSRPPQKNRAARLSKTRNIQTHGNRRPERRAASPLPSDSIRGVVFSSLTSAADAPWRRRRSPQRVPGNREAIIRGPETAAPLQTGSRTMAAPFPGAEREKGKKERHPPTDPGLEPGEDRRTQLKSLRPTIPWILRSSRRMTVKIGGERKRKTFSPVRGRGEKTRRPKRKRRPRSAGTAFHVRRIGESA